MTLEEILGSRELLRLSDEVIPPCPIAAGASSQSVQTRLLYIYTSYRQHELESLKSLMDSVDEGIWQTHPYFPTFAETVIEAYWTCETGLRATGFRVSPALI
jgi:hypothetical protein